MFSDSEWNQIIDKLRQLTESGRIGWEMAPAGLVTDVGDVTYVIGSQDGDDLAPWVLRIRRGEGASWSEIDSLTSMGGDEEPFEPRTKIEPLRDSAFRISQGGPQLAKRLLDDLDRINADPAPPTQSDFNF